MIENDGLNWPHCDVGNSSQRRNGEPNGQLAARELEITRIEGALGHAEELPNDVAAAIEGAAA